MECKGPFPVKQHPLWSIYEAMRANASRNGVGICPGWGSRFMFWDFAMDVGERPSGTTFHRVRPGPFACGRCAECVRLGRLRNGEWLVWRGHRGRAVARHNLKKRSLLDAAKARPCEDCGLSYPPYVMDFDHRPGVSKSFELAKYSSHSIDDIVLEIAKCDVVCANCHRERTHQRRLADRSARETGPGSGWKWLASDVEEVHFVDAPSEKAKRAREAMEQSPGEQHGV